MSIELCLPALSPTMESGTLARWLVKEGDYIAKGAVIAEIETDKATMELEATDEGYVVGLLVPDGTDAVPVGTALAVLGDDRPPEASGKSDEPQSSALVVVEQPPVTPVAAIVVEQPPVTPVAAAPALAPTESAKASPLGARLIAALGIDSATVRGSGPMGRIGLSDLIPRVKPAVAITPSPRTPINSPVVAVPDVPHDARALSASRLAVARQLTEAKQNAPHIYLTIDVHADALLDFRTMLNDGLVAKGVKVTINDVMIRAFALALEQVPSCNVCYQGDRLLTYLRSDITVPMAGPDGIVTPAIKDAASKSFSAIASETRAIAELVRSGTISTDEIQGSASLTNLGRYGIKQFTSIVRPPHATSVAVGAIEKRALAGDQGVEVASMLSITGSFDHRAIDGADGARLMRVLQDLLERPLSMI